MAQDWNDGNGGTALTTTKRVFTSSNPSTAILPADRRMQIITSSDRFGLYIENNTPDGFVLPPPPSGLCFPDIDDDNPNPLFGLYVASPGVQGGINFAAYFDGYVGMCGGLQLRDKAGNGPNWHLIPQGSSSSGYRMTFAPTGTGSGANQMIYNATTDAVKPFVQYIIGNKFDNAFEISSSASPGSGDIKTRFKIDGLGMIEAWNGIKLYDFWGNNKFHVLDGLVESWNGLNIYTGGQKKPIRVKAEQSTVDKFYVRKDGLVWSEGGIRISPDGNSANDAFVIQEDGDGTSEKIFSINKGGFLFAREIRVTQNNIPDYVFKKDYELMPLDELEQFVKVHSHLPNIPSEKEILANGLNLGDQQMNQLEKIEELTLYMIEMNKRMNQLEEENKLLKSKLNSLSSEK